MASNHVKIRSDLAKAFLIPSCQAASDMGFEALNALVQSRVYLDQLSRLLELAFQHCVNVPSLIDWRLNIFGASYVVHAFPSRCFANEFLPEELAFKSCAAAALAEFDRILALWRDSQEADCSGFPELFVNTITAYENYRRVDGPRVVERVVPSLENSYRVLWRAHEDHLAAEAVECIENHIVKLRRRISIFRIGQEALVRLKARLLTEGITIPEL